ncbi:MULTISPECIES: hypothetical protein [unclassified Bradyrhizobium]|uniref:hypothetical protein n=1 Tax=unclassified Bradyrhizobium TaxID=2631580 RepID=UPI0012FAB355|nr:MULTISPECIES: hypothetical protein [unclassified Bradyrhizobium]MBB4262079.1 hypothetical protein [Bradyrhizobium sp. CIR3A]NYG45665.1 hypothetical protein [Bradyrhizobium sp. IAR9]
MEHADFPSADELLRLHLVQLQAAGSWSASLPMQQVDVRTNNALRNHIDGALQL